MPFYGSDADDVGFNFGGEPTAKNPESAKKGEYRCHVVVPSGGWASVLIAGPVVLAESDAWARTFIAVITGRDATYKWTRKWVGQQDPRFRPAPGRIVLVASFKKILDYAKAWPAVLDICWGEGMSSGTLLEPTGSRQAARRAYFSLDPFGQVPCRIINEMELARIVDAAEVPVPARSVYTKNRAPIAWGDEEV